MSSKTSTIGMEEEVKPALVPRLQFPEFREAGGWENKPLSTCLGYKQPTPYLVSDTNYSPAFKTPVLTAGKTFILGYTDEEHGIFSEDLPVIIFDDFTTATKFVDFPFKAKSSAMKILQAKKGANIKFMFETLQSLSYEVGAHERHWISNFAPMLVLVPSAPEQQKIADCLSSVDEVIAAQARKVDTLKTHKKGLMQQLFPREGETQPRLRFPEFTEAGEWAMMTLGNAATFYNGRAYKQEELLESGKYTVLRVGNFFTSKNWYYSNLELDETKYCDDGDLLYAWSASFGPRFWRGSKTIYHYHIWKVVEHCDINRRFLFITLENETEKMKSQSANGLGIMHITKGTIQGWEAAFPPMPEQQRIADCLTSLDDLITEQTQKLEALKIHKKGLMQQLFPSPEEQTAS